MRTQPHTEGRWPCEEETEIRGEQSQAKGHQLEVIPNWKGQGRVLLGGLETGEPHQHLDFTLPNSRTLTGYISVALSHPVYGTLS